ncbi:glycosyltransferase family 4 protein [Mucilaginibacter gynuensis]|uniref:Glycosyltransferase family 4 protein n=1 Tax=Mucilaginibacter gynuensis TaxID=1302236 RepID=A0ABP8H3K9_9SPHI
MKVTLINTSDAGGGAAAACMRLLKALELRHIDVKMLVQQKTTAEPRVTATVSPLKSKIDFFSERLPFMFFQEKDKWVRFAFSPANSGTAIHKQEGITTADVVHLHWTNSGYLSTQNLKQLFALNKPVVWTLHDMWAFTGGCHYPAECDHYTGDCGNCWMLRSPKPNDLSHSGWLKKADMVGEAKNLVIVTCSNWLADVARTSKLLGKHRIVAIPNPIDTAIFSPKDKSAARQKRGIDANAKVILFGAANINDRRKGLTYLVEALHHLKNNYPEAANAEVVMFGKNKHFDSSTLPFKVHELSLISSQAELAEVYSLADVFVSPTVEDNLPNMVMEALACATPVVAFNTGGIPDMIDHQQNGYLAQYKSATDLAAGLNEVLFSGRADAMALAARQKVMANFTNEIVAAKYIEVYQSILSNGSV